MRKSKIIVTSLAVIFVILLMFGTTVFSDQNGMLTEEEQQVSNGDSDGDTLDDAMEYIYYGTDPFNPDTDGDGLTDGEEITQGTDPQDPNNPCTTCLPTPNFEEQTNGDTDGDTLEDAMECIYYGTDPQNPDTDGDGLTDGEEITQGTDPKDPNNPCTTCIPTAYAEEERTVSNGDSDGDMLEDAMECIYYGTDPLNPDTDGDGLTDFEEITQGTNPRDPNDS